MPLISWGLDCNVPRLLTRAALASACPPAILRRPISGASAPLNTVNTTPSIAFFAAESPDARAAFAELSGRYGAGDIAHADIIVVLGGDGTFLPAVDTTLPRVRIWNARCG